MSRTQLDQASVRLTCVLSTLTFPAMKWQLVMHAEHNGADVRTRTELRDLPVGVYRDIESVISTVNTHWLEPAAPPRQPTTPPRAPAAERTWPSPAEE